MRLVFRRGMGLIQKAYIYARARALAYQTQNQAITSLH